MPAWTYWIKVGDSDLFSKLNTRPAEFTDVKVFVPTNGDKVPAANALIRHLNIQGVEFNGE